MDLLDLADRLWRGETSTASHHPVVFSGELCEVTNGVAFVPTFANCTVFTTDDGLFMVDTGSGFTAAKLHAETRRWTGQRLNTAVYSHGHIDHVFGVGVFDDEAVANRWNRPHVVAHEHVARRFDRYRLTAGYNQVVNRRQFGLDNLIWPTEYRYPDETYVDTHQLDVGGLEIHLRHEKGETDDATVTWIASPRVLCTGDLFVWSSPNAGNPQKVQRYPREWAAALRRMADLGAQFLLPGHGLPVVGAERIHQALTETAEYLESLVDQTLSLMNEGARLSDVLVSVTPAPHLADRPFLQPVTTSPSSSCATSGGSTEAGGTATPPRSSQPMTGDWPKNWLIWSAGRDGWPTEPKRWRPKGPTRRCASRATSRRWPGWPLPPTPRSARPVGESSLHARRRPARPWPAASSPGPRERVVRRQRDRSTPVITRFSTPRSTQK